jgi:hypothetical protein
MRRQVRVKFGVAVAAAALLLMAPSTSSAADTTEGSCRMTGEIVFGEPVGLEAERTTFTDFARGTCTGTVNGEFMANERVRLRANGRGLLGCSSTRAHSTGFMRFTRNTPTRTDDVRIGYTSRSRGSFGQIVSRVRGRVSGRAIANVRFRGDETTLRECQQGTFRGGTYDMDGRTVTPLVG